jgi:MFS family permease
MTPAAPSGARAAYRTLPRDIWALGLVSLCMDTSSELIHSVLPLFLVTQLGASMVTIGVLEGVAEATAAVTRVFSGVLSDAFRTRKPLLVLGYGMAALTKPVFPLATSVTWVFGARFADRIGKGIRGAPRDALVADLVPPGQRGAAYGLRQALDSVGAFLGPVLAMLLLVTAVADLTTVLWVAVVPAVAAVALLLFGVREPTPRTTTDGGRPSLALADLRRLPRRYWLVVVLGGVFTLARFSEAFLLLRGQDVGLSTAYVPAIFVVMNVVYAAAAYPAGVAADRLRARTPLLLGLGCLVAANALLAVARTPLVVFAGAACWGLHLAFTQGQLARLVADAAPAQLVGSGFGLFNLVSGGALLLASVVAGALWSARGPAATFVAGGVFATIAALGLLAGGAASRVSPSRAPHG